MTAGGEPLADHGIDPRLDAGEGGGQLDIIGNIAEQTAGFLGFIFPRDAEQIDGINVPQPRYLELFLDFLRDQLGMLHLLDGGDDDIILPRLFNIVP